LPVIFGSSRSLSESEDCEEVGDDGMVWMGAGSGVMVKGGSGVETGTVGEGVQEGAGRSELYWDRRAEEQVMQWEARLIR